MIHMNVLWISIFVIFFGCLIQSIYGQSFSGTINLGKSSLGINFENTPESYSTTGVQIVDIGDINGDGYGDAVVESACTLYVIFGSYSAISVDLQYLVPPYGFNITGPFGSSCYDLSVTALGDINGDEFSDLLVGNTDATVNPIIPYYYIILGNISMPNINLNNVEGVSNVISIVYNGMYDYASSNRRLTETDSFEDNPSVEIPKKMKKPIDFSPRKKEKSSPSLKPPPSIESLREIAVESDDSCPYTQFEVLYNYTLVSEMDVYDLQIYLGISGLGDVNNDGYNDLILMHSLSHSDTTVTFSVIFGGPSLNSTINLTALSSNEGFTIVGDGGTFPTIVSLNTQYNGYTTACVTNATTGEVTYVYTYQYYEYYIYSYEVAAGWCGDINHDGYDDILLGSGYAYDYAGEVFVLYGKSSFPSTFSLSSLTSSQGFIIYGAGKENSLYAGDQTGLAVTGNFDFNNDGIDDILIGAPYANAFLGICYIIFGTSGSFDLTNNGLYLETLNPDQGIGIYASTQSAFGYSVSRAGDYTGDGIDDVIIGAPGAGGGAGIAYILYGSTGQKSNIQISTLTVSQGKEIIGIKNTNGNQYCQTGYAVSGGSDFNRDGLSDVFVGAPYQEAGSQGADTGAGAGYCVFGTTTEILSLYLKYLTTVYTYSATSATTSTPITVNNVGDVNSNGYEDFAIGAFLQASSYVILSSATGYQSVSSLSSLDAGLGYSVTSNVTDSWLGFAVDDAGDMNGDGIPDWMIGAPYKFAYVNQYPEPFDYYLPYATNLNPGYVYVVYGSSSSEDISVVNYKLPANKGITIEGLPASGLGISVAGIANFNRLKGTTKLGSIAIGAPLYTTSDGSYSSGIMYLISGSHSMPSFINLADYSSIFASIPIITIVGETNCNGLLGWSVNSAGDINSDGYADVIFSAPNANNNLDVNTTYYETGMIYILLGGSYLNKSQTMYVEQFPSLKYGITITGANEYDEAGYSVSGIGDFNGDGYADYAIGAPFANYYAGITYILFGSANPPSTIALSTIGTSAYFAQGFTISGQNAYDYSGWNVASAGDVNHDGLADVILSAPGANTFSGTVYIVYGAHSMTSNVDLGTLTSAQGVIILNNILYTQVGWTVSSYSDKKGNVLALFGNNPTAANKATGIAYAIVPSSVPVNQTIAPTPRPTAAPTEYPTYSPTLRPTYGTPSAMPTVAPTLPPFWVQNQGIILGVVIPATTSFIPIYFSKQICFYALEHWSAANNKRGLFQIGMYNLCKKVYLADFVESKETQKAKKDIDKEEKEREEKLKPHFELTVMEKLKQMKESDEEAGSSNVINPLNNGLIADAPDESQRSRTGSQASFKKVSAFQNNPLMVVDQQQEEVPQRTNSMSRFRVSEALIDSDDEDEERGGAGGNNDVVVKAVYSIHYDHPEIQLLLLEGKFKTTTILSQSLFHPIPDASSSGSSSSSSVSLITESKESSLPKQDSHPERPDASNLDVNGYNWFEDIALVRYVYRVILLPLLQQNESHYPTVISFLLDSKILLVAGHFLVELFFFLSTMSRSSKEKTEEQASNGVGSPAETEKNGKSGMCEACQSILRTVVFGARLLLISWLQQWFYPSLFTSPRLSSSLPLMHHIGYCASITAVYSLQSTSRGSTSLSRMIPSSSFFWPRLTALTECFFLQSQPTIFTSSSSSWMIAWLPLLIDVFFLSWFFLFPRTSSDPQKSSSSWSWWMVLRQLVLVDYASRLAILLIFSLLF